MIDERLLQKLQVDTAAATGGNLRTPPSIGLEKGFARPAEDAGAAWHHLRHPRYSTTTESGSKGKTDQLSIDEAFTSLS
jgi:hypothetical protein